MGQCPIPQLPLLARRHAALGIQNTSILDADTGVEICTLRMKMRWRVIVEIQQNQNAIDNRNGRHGRYELRTRRTASCQPA